jgi:hypothetical protein
LRAAIDEGDASGIAEGDVFARVREALHLCPGPGHECRRESCGESPQPSPVARRRSLTVPDSQRILREN